MKNDTIKASGISLPINWQLFALSFALSIPVAVLGENILLTLPVLIIVTLSFILGEKFIIGIVLISLFTLIGELSTSLRSVVHLVDFTLLGILFLKRFGLNFNSYQKIPKSITLFLALYFTSMIISTSLSKYPSAGISPIAQQAAFFIIVYIFYSLVKDENDIKNYFRAIVAVSCIFVSVLIISFFRDGNDLLMIISKNRTRVSAITGNIEAATNFIVVSFPLVITTLLLKKNSADKFFNWLLLFYFSLGLTLAMSRSALIGIIVSTSILLFILRRKLLYKYFIILIAILLLFLIIEPLSEIAFFFFRIEEGLSTRDYIWTMSLNMIKDYTLFGIGPGTYKYQMFNYFPFMLDDWYGKLYILFYEVTGGANLSHNIFLVFFTEMGLLGFITAIALPVIYCRIGVKTIAKYKNESTAKYYFIVGLFSAGSSIIVRNLFNSIGLLYVGGIHTDLPFWLIFGSLIYFYRVPLTVSAPLNDQQTQ
jgi:O-antigen ligase